MELVKTFPEAYSTIRFPDFWKRVLTLEENLVTRLISAETGDAENIRQQIKVIQMMKDIPEEILSNTGE